MSRKKTKRLAELPGMPNVFTPDDVRRQGGITVCFAQPQPLVLELGCGRGETTVEMARRDPGRNYLGVDIKGARLHRGASAALSLGVTNVAFLNAVVEMLPEVADNARCETIWLLFPDPFPKPSKARRRLTSPKYLDLYRRLLGPGSRVHLKTDEGRLFDYTLDTVARSGGRILQRIDALEENGADTLVNLQSAYEKRWRAEGRTIGYLCFSLD